jgi:hypothetical protein
MTSKSEGFWALFAAQRQACWDALRAEGAVVLIDAARRGA